jgi:hypothetical protein
MPLGDDHRRGIVLRGFAEVEDVVAFAVRQRLAEAGIAADRDAVGPRDAILDDLRRGTSRVLRLDEIGRGLGDLRHGDAVEPQNAVLHLHGVTGQADDTLDPVVVLARRLDDRDVAAVGVAAEDAPLHLGQDRQRWRQVRIAVRVFRHDQPVTGQQRRQHRFRRNEEGLGDEAVDRQHRQNEDQQLTKLARPIDLFLGLGHRHRIAHTGLPVTWAVISTIACAQG